MICLTVSFTNYDNNKQKQIILAVIFLLSDDNKLDQIIVVVNVTGTSQGLSLPASPLRLLIDSIMFVWAMGIAMLRMELGIIPL